MRSVPSPLLISSAVLGGYVVGRRTGNRALAGVALLAGLGGALPRWTRSSPLLAAALGAGTVGLVGLSHPLAHRVGPWPAVRARPASLRFPVHRPTA